MGHIVTDGVAWSVCRSVRHDREPCKNGRTDRDTVCVVDWGGIGNHVLWGFSYIQRKGANFEGKGAAHCKM